jgi:hypothetical protein
MEGLIPEPYHTLRERDLDAGAFKCFFQFRQDMRTQRDIVPSDQGLSFIKGDENGFFLREMHLHRPLRKKHQSLFRCPHIGKW